MSLYFYLSLYCSDLYSLRIFFRDGLDSHIEVVSDFTTAVNSDDECVSLENEGDVGLSEDKSGKTNVQELYVAT